MANAAMVLEVADDTGATGDLAVEVEEGRRVCLPFKLLTVVERCMSGGEFVFSPS